MLDLHRIAKGLEACAEIFEGDREYNGHGMLAAAVVYSAIGDGFSYRAVFDFLIDEAGRLGRLKDARPTDPAQFGDRATAHGTARMLLDGRFDMDNENALNEYIHPEEYGDVEIDMLRAIHHCAGYAAYADAGREERDSIKSYTVRAVHDASKVIACYDERRGSAEAAGLFERIKALVDGVQKMDSIEITPEQAQAALDVLDREVGGLGSVPVWLGGAGVATTQEVRRQFDAGAQWHSWIRGLWRVVAQIPKPSAAGEAYPYSALRRLIESVLQGELGIPIVPVDVVDIRAQQASVEKLLDDSNAAKGDARSCQVQILLRFFHAVVYGESMPGSVAAAAVEAAAWVATLLAESSDMRLPSLEEFMRDLRGLTEAKPDPRTLAREAMMRCSPTDVLFAIFETVQDELRRATPEEHELVAGYIELFHVVDGLHPAAARVLLAAHECAPDELNQGWASLAVLDEVLIPALKIRVGDDAEAIVTSAIDSFVQTLCEWEDDHVFLRAEAEAVANRFIARLKELAAGGGESAKLSAAAE